MEEGVQAKDGLRIPSQTVRNIVEKAAEGLNDFSPAWDELDPIAKQVVAFLSPQSETKSVGAWKTLEEISEKVRIDQKTALECLDEAFEAGFVISRWSGPARDEALFRIQVPVGG